MVPVYETDLNRDRTRPSDWDHYELWEKVELRERRRRRLWIGLTALISISLLAIPVVSESRSHWSSERLARELSQYLGELKRKAVVSRSPQRLVFDPSGELRFRVEAVSQCSRPSTSEGAFFPQRLRGLPEGEVYRLVMPSQGERLGLAHLIQEFCFDPVHPDERLIKGAGILGFALGSVKDLSEGRLEGLAVVLIRGESAEISFN